MYLNGEGRPVEQLPLFLTMIATVIIPITNVLTVYVYWKPVHPAFLWSLLLSVTFDVFYHIVLLNWYFNGVVWNENDQAPPQHEPADILPDDYRELYQTENVQLDQQNNMVEVEGGIADNLETIENDQAPPQHEPADILSDDHRELYQIDIMVEVEAGIANNLETINAHEISVNNIIMDDKSKLIFVNANSEAKVVF